MTSLSPAATGSVVSFYSFKGGVGRSMLLAHLAWVLASCGKRVLVVDWDLEAPGLREYFRGRRDPGDGRGGNEPGDLADGIDPLGAPDEERGVVDLVGGYLQVVQEMIEQEIGRELKKMRADPPCVPQDVRDRATRAAVGKLQQAGVDELTYLQAFVTPVDVHDSVTGSIDFMPAGKWDASYAGRMADIDWRRLLDELGGDVFLERLRKRMKASYNYVLVDSRTGISDTSGICTTILPDSIVICFSANDQNVLNSRGVARYVRAVPDRKIDILPVPCRVNLSNNAAVRKARNFYERSFKGFVDHHPDVSERDYWERVLIPYSARYSYTETPPLSITSEDDRVLGAVEFLAKNLTDDLDLRFMAKPERWIELLQTFKRPALESDYERVVISHAPGDEPIATWIEWLLQEHRLLVRRQRVEHLDRRILDQELAETGGDRANPRSGGKLCVMPLLSAEYVSLPHAQETWRWARNRVTDRGCDTLFPVRVEQFERQRPFDEQAHADLVGRNRDGARSELLEAIDDRLAAEDELSRQPEPVFPVEGRAYVSRLLARERRLADEGDTAAQIETLLALARRYWDNTSIARGYLDQVIDVARSRGDPLKEALAGYLAAALGRDADDVEASARQATDAVLQLAERDVVGGTDGRLVLLSDSSDFRDDVQELAASKAVVRHRIEPRRLPKFVLADGIVARLVGDYPDARKACVAARFHAASDPELLGRCDVEIGYVTLLEQRRKLDPSFLLAAERNFQRATRCGDPAVCYLASLGLGFLEQLRERFDLAERSFEKALWFVSAVPVDESSTVEYRRSVVYTCLGALSGRIGRLVPSLSQHGARSIADRFEPALKEATPVWPRVSLPLAWALEKSCADDSSVPPQTKHLRAIQALWTYYTLGFRDRMEECRRLAFRHSPARGGQSLMTVLRESAVPDRGFVFRYLSDGD
jgi:hypothetical protein